MKTITLAAKSGQSRLLINERLENLHKHCDVNKTVVITDKNTADLYGNGFKNFKTIIISGEEKDKNLETAGTIYKKLLEFSCDRHSFIVGLGGGAVTDMTGFVASTFLRGVRFGFVPTTLLAQVDAGIGGKNGVNFMGSKNMIGTITQPDFVIIDANTLKTLSAREFISGIGEIIKYSIIAGEDFFNQLAGNLYLIISEFQKKSLSEKTEAILSYLIEESIKIKVDIVEKDEKETGLRKVLNLGHTLAHAIELTEDIPHGEAVIKGIKFAADFSTREEFLNIEENRKITNMLELTGVSTYLGIKTKRDKIKEAICHDKKKKQDTIDFVFIRNAGDVFVSNIKLKTIWEVVDDMCINQ
ncbi:MAG: 3-dehydroquinate synthase [Spirochaetes bacterium]|nr:3-dehydroquinate synthase [Spirochaetota bacterium]